MRRVLMDVPGDATAGLRQMHPSVTYGLRAGADTQLRHKFLQIDGIRRHILIGTICFTLELYGTSPETERLFLICENEYDSHQAEFDHAGRRSRASGIWLYGRFRGPGQQSCYLGSCRRDG